jgi:hypothetical protein
MCGLIILDIAFISFEGQWIQRRKCTLMHDEHRIPRWLFIGGILLFFGVLICGAGLYSLSAPPAVALRVARYAMQADLWWGAFMASVGVFYCVRYNPPRRAR